MKKTILLLAVAAGALAVQPAFAHTPAGAGGPPPGVTVGPPAAAKTASHISANGLLHSNGLKNDSDRVFGADRAAEVHAAKAEDKATDRDAKAQDKIDDRNRLSKAKRPGGT